MIGRRRFRALLILAVPTLVAGCGGPEAPPAPPPVPVFSAQRGYPLVSGEIIEHVMTRNPARATSIGEHGHDRELPALFPTDLERARREAHGLLARLRDVHQPVLDRPDFFDYRVLEHALHAELLELETLQAWQRDPARYVRVVDGAIDVLYADPTLSPDGRLGAIAARLRAAPLVFRAARQNLEPTRVPPLFARMAVEEAQQLARGLSAGDSPPGFSGTSNAVRAEWEGARRVAVASADSFVTWLQQSVLPAARGDFRMGAAALAEYLRYAHHADLPLDQMQAINRQAIADYREWLEREALQFDPLRRPADILESMVASTPGATLLIAPEAVPATPSSASIVRRLLPASATAAAWAHFEDVDGIESEATSRADRLLGIARALHGHALLEAMLSLHAADGTIDRAAEDIAAIAYISRDEARREAERLAYDPAYGLPALGRMQLIALREQLRAQRGGTVDGTFGQTFLGLALPFGPAAEAMLGREPTGLLTPGRRTPGVPEPPRIGQ
ncbi:MAG TPA: DUF885 family protein [Longimicrobiales bacterium]